MKTVLFPFILLLITTILHAQNSKPANTGKHKVVFQMVSADTNDHKTLMRQLDNFMTMAPQSELEVVCHGQGLELLVKEKCIVSDKLKILVGKGIRFVACEVAMKNMKVDKAMLLPSTGTVPSGLIEIVTKEEEGWSYIKAGH
jgi:intracellular sulfur oxidation DsrE/DsrF family protein